jgi:hypothetical protein
MVNWQIDKAAAAELDGMDVAWEVKHIEHAQINVGESRQNGARRHRLDESAVADYRESMQRGDTFPMIVVCKISGSAGYVIAGGNHRHAAFAGLSKSPFPAMCCSVSAVQFAILSRRLNRTNGKRETRADRIKQAAELVAVYGLTQQAAADAMDVSEAALGRELRSGTVRQAIVAATGDDCAEAPNGVILAMWPFRNEHNVLAQLAVLAKNGASTDEMTAVVREVKKLPTEAAKVQALAGKCEQRKRASVGGRNVSLQIAQGFRRMVTQLENIIAKGEACNMQMDGPELAAIAKRVATAAAAVRAMSGGRS